MHEQQAERERSKVEAHVFYRGIECQVEGDNLEKLHVAERPQAKRRREEADHHGARGRDAVEGGCDTDKQGEYSEQGQERAHHEGEHMAGIVVAIRIFRREQVKIVERLAVVIDSVERPQLNRLARCGMEERHIVESAADELAAGGPVVAIGIDPLAALEHIEGHMHRTEAQGHCRAGKLGQVEPQGNGIAIAGVRGGHEFRNGGNLERIASKERHPAAVQAGNRRRNAAPANHQERGQRTDQETDGQSPSNDSL